uniref:Defensin n=1 Tax=Brassica juncea var. juncea TaxID=660055 RepID=A0A173GPA7_BRAJU|nr:defensin [Brassica juncea var. juncea]
MAKFVSIIALLFAALVLFAALEAPTMVEAQKLCQKSSGTRSGVYGNINACKNPCINLEKARHQVCNYVDPAHKYICYFPC